ncbi:MAG: hypothetical protein K2H92_09810 [Bacteroidaceae bacterium]|nr:hypothetical protein [Bacteroidaceae bacterium]MDE6721433.1 hypothetical protein [Bacteroidaceae bacterium]
MIVALIILVEVAVREAIEQIVCNASSQSMGQKYEDFPEPHNNSYEKTLIQVESMRMATQFYQLRLSQMPIAAMNA